MSEHDLISTAGRWPYFSVELALWPGESHQIGDVVEDFGIGHQMAVAAVQVRDIFANDNEPEPFALIYGESRTFDDFDFEGEPESEEEDFDWYMEGEGRDPATREQLACVAGDGLHLPDSERAVDLSTKMQDAFEDEIAADRSPIDDPDRELAAEHGAAFYGSAVSFPSLDAARAFGEARAQRSMQKMLDGMRGYTDEQAQRANALYERWEKTSTVARQKNAQALAAHLLDIHVFGRRNPRGRSAGGRSAIAPSTRKIVEVEVAEVIATEHADHDSGA
jgi:hypothetical protein